MLGDITGLWSLANPGQAGAKRLASVLFSPLWLPMFGAVLSSLLHWAGTRAELNTNIVIVETDYSSYAIMYYQKRGQITMKLYGGWAKHHCCWHVYMHLFKKRSAVCTGRSVDNLSEPMLTKFEQLAGKQNMGLAFLFPFPTYSRFLFTVWHFFTTQSFTSAH